MIKLCKFIPNFIWRERPTVTSFTVNTSFNSWNDRVKEDEYKEKALADCVAHSRINRRFIGKFNRLRFQSVETVLDLLVLISM